MKTELIKSAMAYNRQRYPNVPEHALPKPKYSDKTANGLTKMIIDWIRFHGGMSERINSMGIYDAKLGKYRPSGSRKGTSDISTIINGRSLRIEVKIGRDRLSEYQKRYGREVEASGGLFFVARSFEEFYKWIVNLKLI